MLDESCSNSDSREPLTIMYRKKQRRYVSPFTLCAAVHTLFAKLFQVFFLHFLFLIYSLPLIDIFVLGSKEIQNWHCVFISYKCILLYVIVFASTMYLVLAFNFASGWLERTLCTTSQLKLRIAFSFRAAQTAAKTSTKSLRVSS